MIIFHYITYVWTIECMKNFVLTADQLEGNGCGLDDWGSVPCGMEFIFFIYPEWIKKIQFCIHRDPSVK